MAKVRAVENNRYLVRSANFDPAFAIDNTGRIIAEAPWDTAGVIYTTVHPIKKQSLYNKGRSRFSF